MTIIKEKTLRDFAVENKINTVEELLKVIEGRKIRTSNINRSGHSYPKKFKIGAIHPNYVLQDPKIANKAIQILIAGQPQYHNSTIYLQELLLDSISVEDLKKEAEKYSTVKATIEKQIQLCEEFGLEEIDEEILKVVSALELTKDEDNKLLKAKKILEIINT